MKENAVKKKAGRPPWNPDERVIAEVERMGGIGLTMEQIAYNLGISPATLYAKKRLFMEFSEAIKRGAAKANEVVVNKLFELAVGGNVVACIYWTKTRMGWKESSSSVELSGPNAGPIALTPVPQPVLSHEEQERIGMETARILQRAGALPVLSDDPEQKS